MSLLNRLRSLKVETLQPEDAIELLVTAKAVKAEFDARQMEVPDFIEQGIVQLNREISSRNADNLERRLAELKARRLSLTPRAERLKEIDEELAALQAAKAKV